MLLPRTQLVHVNVFLNTDFTHHTTSFFLSEVFTTSWSFLVDWWINKQTKYKFARVYTFILGCLPSSISSVFSHHGYATTPSVSYISPFYHLDLQNLRVLILLKPYSTYLPKVSLTPSQVAPLVECPEMESFGCRVGFQIIFLDKYISVPVGLSNMQSSFGLQLNWLCMRSIWYVAHAYTTCSHQIVRHVQTLDNTQHFYYSTCSIPYNLSHFCLNLSLFNLVSCLYFILRSQTLLTLRASPAKTLLLK